VKKMSILDPYSPEARAIAVVLRTAHLAMMAMLVGALFFAAPASSIRTWQALTAGTGAALLVTEISHSRHWVYQGRGIITIAHVALAWLAPSGLVRPAAAAALVIGGLGSHLPRAVRKWSFRHRQVMD